MNYLDHWRNDGDSPVTDSPSFSTQLTSVVYGASTTSCLSVAARAGTNTAGSGTMYSGATGPRVSLIQNTGLGHNWPGGEAPGGSYISANSIDYPA